MKTETKKTNETKGHTHKNLVVAKYLCHGVNVLLELIQHDVLHGSEDVASPFQQQGRRFQQNVRDDFRHFGEIGRCVHDQREQAAVVAVTTT